MPCSWRFCRNWWSPWRLKPDDGPQISPLRDKARDSRYESKEPTSSTASTDSSQGNSALATRARGRGPGTLSAGSVKILSHTLSIIHWVCISSGVVPYPTRVIDCFAFFKNEPVPTMVPTLEDLLVPMK